VNGEKLNHLRFADDIVLISDQLDEANEVVSELSAASQKVGLKINIAKTQFMTTNLVPSCNLMIEGKDYSIRNILQISGTRDPNGKRQSDLRTKQEEV